MKVIKYQNLSILVDDEVAPTITFISVDNSGYVKATIGGVHKALHRLLVKSAKGSHIHHKNGNKLDCQRANLQTETPSQHLHHHVSERRKSFRQFKLENGIKGRVSNINRIQQIMYESI